MEASAFESRLKERTAYAQRVLKEHLPKEEGLQGRIMEAMNYSLLAGGKRLRPVLMYETYRMCGGEEADAIEHFMAAIEMIHTYSLVHDDLPAMDNDRYRRGKETTWYVYGETLGILAGDGLLNYAFETALGALRTPERGQEADCGDFCRERLTRMERAAAALSVLAGKAGIYGMIGGQVVDVMAEKGFGQDGKGFGQAEKGFGQDGKGFGQDGKGFGQAGKGFGQDEKGFGQAGKGFGQAEKGFGQDGKGFGQAGKGFGQAEKGFGQDGKDPGRTETAPVAERLLFIHAHKTAALIQAAMMIGAILAGASKEQTAAIEKCAYNIGIAFQIQDDILDVTGDSKELGKSTGSDAANRKETYVTWKGLEQSQADVEALSREAAGILDGFSGEHEFLKQLILTLIHRRK